MDALTLAHRITVPSTVLAREVDGETVLLNLESGVYFGLDAVGTDMWRVLCTGVTLEETAHAIEAAYEVERSQLAADILRLVEELAASGLVTVRPA
jgi:hypothetical protein